MSDSNVPEVRGGALLRRLTERVAEPGDSSDLRLQKGLLVRASFVVIVAGVIWGSMYLAFGEPLAGAIPLTYSALSLLSFAGFLATRNYDLYRSSQLLLVLLLPFLLMLALGGFVNSSAVVLWSVLCPLGALVFDRPERAPRWMLAYLVLLVLGGLVHADLRSSNNLPPTMVVPLFFVLNLGSVSAVAFLMLRSFMRQKDQAHQELRQEQQRSTRLLLNVLPEEIAPRLMDGDQTVAEQFDSASVLFADIVGSTILFADMHPTEIVDWLNEVFSMFDSLVERYELEKIRTIGDNYMVAAGVPRRRTDHAQALGRMALEMRDQLQALPSRNGRRIEFRMGMNSGSMVAGVIGRTKFHYDLWGDTVNTASRMESHGEPGKIQVTQASYALLRDQFVLEPRGSIPVKGKGEMPTWYLVGEN